MWLHIILVILGLYWWSVRNFNYWKKRGVIYYPPVPIFGNIWKTVLGLSSSVDEFMTIYKKYPNEKYVGIYYLQTPGLLIRDPDLVKQLCIKDFEYFHDHALLIFKEETDPIMAKSLFSLTGETWRELRMKMTSIFTGNKMRMMFGLVKDCAEQLVTVLKDDLNKSEEVILKMEMKTFFERYTDDVIATCAFGIKSESIKNPNNEFAAMGKFISNINTIKLVFVMTMTKIMGFLGIGMIPKHVNEFFRHIISETIEIREKNNIIRPDMIHLLMQARKGQLKNDGVFINDELVDRKDMDTAKDIKWNCTNDDIVAQAMIFYLAGHDTGSTILSFAIQEIAMNMDVQKKIQEEIDETLQKCDGKLSYDALMEMQYIDMVVNETLRRWLPGIVTERKCTKPYDLITDNSVLRIEKGISVFFPVHAIQRDEKYFPNPDVFDPERFNEENKRTIGPQQFFPFGTGPRKCIGYRFAIMSIKIGIIHLLANFNCVVIDKTDLKMKLNEGIKVTLKEGYWVGLTERKKII